jgi:large repetitive protein
MSAPTATITINDPLVGGNDLPTVTVTFSEPVFNFDLSDIFSPGGFLTNLESVSSSVFTLRYNPFPNFDADNVFVRVNLTGLTDRGDPPVPGAGVSDSALFTVDTIRPTVTQFTISDPVLRIGETATVTIKFSEAVTLPIGNLFAQEAVYSNLATADGGITYTATLTPNVNAESHSVIGLQLNGATDAAGNTTGAAQPGPNLNLNTIRPTVTITIDDDTVKAGQTATATFTFSESVNGFDVNDISAFGIAGSLQSPLPTGLTTFTASFTPFTDVTDLSNVFSVDMMGVSSATSGNTGLGLIQSPNIGVDTQRPTAAISMADTNLGSGQTSLVTFTFSEAVTGFTNADLTVENGTLSSVTTSDGGVTWTGTFTPTAGVNDDTNQISLDLSGVSDAFGNAGVGAAAQGYGIDSTAPTLLSVLLPDPALYLGNPMIVEFVFSEVVTGFTAADVTFPNARLSTPVSADGITWLAALQPPITAVEDATNVLTVNLAGVIDAAGNAGVGTATSANYAVDTLRPEVVITLSDAALAVGEPATVTFTFNGAVTGFGAGNILAENGTVSAPVSTDGGRVWTATYTPTVGVNDATNLIAVNKTGILDLAGNPGAGQTFSPNIAIDSTAPTATITISDAAVVDGDQPTVTFTFSEAGVVFTPVVPNGSLGPYTISNGGLTYTARYFPGDGVDDATNVIRLAAGARDAAGNLLTGDPQSANFTIKISSFDPDPPAPPPPPPPPAPPPPPPGPAPPAGVVVLSGSVNSDVITGTAQANMVAGGEGTDTIGGDAGDDTIAGDAGDDNLQGNTGLDSIAGGTGTDTLHGGQDTDLVQGGADNDVVFGDRGADTVHGGQGDDLVLGGDGDDYVSGDRGSDTLTGGAGADVFHGFGGAGLDVVTDFSRAEGDLVRLDAGTTYTAAQVGADTVITISGGGQMILAGVQLASLTDGWIVVG